MIQVHLESRDLDKHVGRRVRASSAGRWCGIKALTVAEGVRLG